MIQAERIVNLNRKLLMSALATLGLLDQQCVAALDEAVGWKAPGCRSVHDGAYKPRSPSSVQDRAPPLCFDGWREVVTFSRRRWSSFPPSLSLTATWMVWTVKVDLRFRRGVVATDPAPGVGVWELTTEVTKRRRRRLPHKFSGYTRWFRWRFKTRSARSDQKPLFFSACCFTTCSTVISESR